MPSLAYRQTLKSFLLILLIFLFSAVAGASDTGLSGWEKDSQYNTYYNYKERDSLKGKILKFEKVVPLPGMAPGTAFVLEEGEDRILVHLCPWSFAEPQKTGIRKGIKTKIKGCWAEIDGQDVFIAAKVKQGDSFEFKVRLTKDGTPFWLMSPEDLAAQKASQ